MVKHHDQKSTTTMVKRTTTMDRGIRKSGSDLKNFDDNEGPFRNSSGI
jgi:hypothetical protein